MRTKPRIQIFIFIIALLSGAVTAQHYVPLEPQNKNVIYEEFTGVKCPNCPSGHTVLAQILAANPERAFAVAYHPFNSSYTLPYTGDPDFRRHYADSLYMTPWCGTSRYMPSAFVHRRLWVPGERLTERTNWDSYGATIMNEASPLNVGMATRYDSITQILTVLVDVYYTAPVTGTQNLMVTLAENNLESQQSGATGTYVHKHTFRESMTAQWGDFLCENPQPGTFFTRQFTFDNSATGYIMENCELMAFVLDNSSTEVVSGIGCAVGDTTFITPDISLSTDSLIFTTATQCLNGLTATIRNNTTSTINLIDVAQYNMVPGPISWFVDPWPFTVFPYTLAPGDSVNLKVHVILPLDLPQPQFLYDSLKITSEVDSRYLVIAVDQNLYTGFEEQYAENTAQVLLLNNRPNPVIDNTTIGYIIPERQMVRLELLNFNGRILQVLDQGIRESGTHCVRWNCQDETGKKVPGGIYFYRLVTDSKVVTRRFIVLPGN